MRQSFPLTDIYFVVARLGRSWKRFARRRWKHVDSRRAKFKDDTLGWLADDESKTIYRRADSRRRSWWTQPGATSGDTAANHKIKMEYSDTTHTHYSGYIRINYFVPTFEFAWTMIVLNVFSFFSPSGISDHTIQALFLACLLVGRRKETTHGDDDHTIKQN